MIGIHRIKAHSGSALVAALLLAISMSAPAVAAPGLGLEVIPLPKRGVPLGGRAHFNLKVTNGGDSTFSSEPLTVQIEISEGHRITSVQDELDPLPLPGPPPWNCEPDPEDRSASCSFDPALMALQASEFPIVPGSEPCTAMFFGFTCRVGVTTNPEPGAPLGGQLEASAEVCGGGAPDCAADSGSITVIPHFQVIDFDGGTFDQEGDFLTQAGSHPDTATTSFMLTESAAADGFTYAIEDLKDEVVDLPPGLIIDPSEQPRCSEAQLSGAFGEGGCPLASQVGTVALSRTGRIWPPAGQANQTVVPLFNMEPPAGVAALFGLRLEGAVVHILGTLQPDQAVPGGYRLRMLALNAPQTVSLVGSKFTLWGVPADPNHDSERGGISDAEGLPMLSLPTSCLGAIKTEVSVTTWQGSTANSSFLSHPPGNPPEPVAASGCRQLQFAPAAEIRPTSSRADTPTGLAVELRVPQASAASELATAHLKSVALQLPAGFVPNPAAANGLLGCSEEAIALVSNANPNCPAESRLGTAAVETPLVEDPISGSVFLAEPYQNPLGALLAVYVAIEDPRSGVALKLAGKVNPDPSTGRLTAVFDEAPQLPFSALRLRLFDGPLAPLTTPRSCGAYVANSRLTPWSAPESGPPVDSSDLLSVTRAASGGICGNDGPPATPDASIHAGAIEPLAGARTPFILRIERQPGSPVFESLVVRPPAGVSADIAGIPFCPEAVLTEIEARATSRRSCPTSTRVGSVTALAGSGSSPFGARGDVFLAGRYKNAPLSLAAVLPGDAGPFELGRFVVRVALHLNSLSGRLRLASDRLPLIRRGIPLDIRALQIALDRRDFTRNPTSCRVMRVRATAATAAGTNEPLSNRFQLGGCRKLPFRPHLGLRFAGATSRNGHPSVRAVFRAPGKTANLKKAVVRLPRGELIDVRRLGEVCPVAQFADRSCPPGSIIGSARADTEQLDNPLRGRIYLRESGRRYPDIAVDLRGTIDLALIGQVDFAHNSVQVSFANLPDLPVRRFALRLLGGHRGLLVNSDGLCSKQQRASASLLAHNGAGRRLRSAIGVACQGETSSGSAERR